LILRKDQREGVRDLLKSQYQNGELLKKKGSTYAEDKGRKGICFSLISEGGKPLPEFGKKCKKDGKIRRFLNEGARKIRLRKDGL